MKHFMARLPWPWKCYVLVVAIFGYQFVGHYCVPYVMYPGWFHGEKRSEPPSDLKGFEQSWISHESGKTEV
ncbi:MAG: hypothetical protein AAF191_17550, partial [Verrucomicrobiota bacterium]